MLVAGRKLSNLNVTCNGKATGNGEDAEEGDEDEGDTSDLRPLALDVEVGMVREANPTWGSWLTERGAIVPLNVQNDCVLGVCL